MGRLARPLVLLLAGVIACAGCGGAGRAKKAPPGPPTVRALHSMPGTSVPILSVTRPARDVSPGSVFVAQKGGDKGTAGGPLIVDNRGRVRWYHQLTEPLQATDFRVQTYRGKPVLTWWQGHSNKAGVGRGEYEIYSASYRRIATVRAVGDGLEGDLHEFQLTPRGTAYITVYHEVPADLRSVGGPEDGWIYDSIVQEIDVATGRLVFQWHSFAHVPLADSLEANHEPARHATERRPLDYFHVNSVADAPGGHILISARNTSTIYELARDGSIVWRLGGKHSDFGPPASVRFFYQHNARLHPGNLLTLFDNGAIPKSEPYTRPLELRLDLKTHRATLVKVFAHPGRLLSPYEGDLQLLPDGGALVGWGGIRRVTEFTPAGQVRFELKLPFGDTYRGYRAVWQGRPAGLPLAAVDGGTVYASWNGSMDVASWEVLAGPDPGHLRQIASAPWSGLETAIPVQSAAQVVAVRALGTSGRRLATSAPVDR